MQKQPVIVEWEGRWRRLSDLAKEHGIRYTTLYIRYVKNGWDLRTALTTPILRTKTYEYKGQWLTAKQLAEIHGNITQSGMHRRLASGMSVEEALELKNYNSGGAAKPNKKRPKYCCDPDCFNCPYPDCAW